jgi:small subunit ribosomal protein S6
MMNHYETLFVVKPTLTEEEINAQIDKVKAVLEKEGAELVATDTMGMRKLAYPVQKHNRGFYTVLFYKAPGSAIAELERNLRINEEIIKFLTVKYVKGKEIAQFNKLVDTAKKKSQAPEPEAPQAQAEAPKEPEAPAAVEAAAEAPATEAPAESEAATTTKEA